MQDLIRRNRDTSLGARAEDRLKFSFAFKCEKCKNPISFDALEEVLQEPFLAICRRCGTPWVCFMRGGQMTAEVLDYARA